MSSIPRDLGRMTEVDEGRKETNEGVSPKIFGTLRSRIIALLALAGIGGSGAATLHQAGYTPEKALNATMQVFAGNEASELEGEVAKENVQSYLAIIFDTSLPIETRQRTANALSELIDKAERNGMNIKDLGMTPDRVRDVNSFANLPSPSQERDTNAPFAGGEE